MFNDYSSDDSSNSFFQDDEPEQPLDEQPKKGAKGFKFNSKNFLGMTAPQRFIISVLLMMMVCTIGSMFLMITEKIAF